MSCKTFNNIIEALYKHLKLDAKKHTTNDLMFTLEIVSCLGACGLAPVLVINDDVHPSMTPEGAIALIDKIVEQENSKEAEGAN